MTPAHDRLEAMITELDDKGFRPDQIAQAVQRPLDVVMDVLDELDLIPTQVITIPAQEAPVSPLNIEWSEPPAPASRGRHASKRLDEVVEALRTRPGQWAKVATGRASAGATTWTKRGCEAVSRRDDVDGKARYSVWARWPAS